MRIAENRMSDHDILSDAEREALSAVMLEPGLPPQRVLIVDDDKDSRDLLAFKCSWVKSVEIFLKARVGMKTVRLYKLPF